MSTKSKFWLCFLSAILGVSVAARGESRISMTSDIAGDEVSGELIAGEIIPVTLFVEADGDKGVLGLELDLTCPGENLWIRQVTFNPAFSVVIGPADPTLPARSFRTVRAQAPVGLNRTLGTGGARTEFAYVELEVLGAGPFESALEVRSKGVLMAAAPSTTIVLGADSAPRQAACGSIVIANTQASDQGGEMMGMGGEGPMGLDSGPPACDEAEVSIEVRPLGSETAVTNLAAHTDYELRYTTEQEPIDAYILFASAASPAQGLSGGTQPSDGPWAGTNLFIFDSAAEAFGPPGEADSVARQHIVMDEIWPHTGAGAGSQGHLCNLTTGDAGMLVLELYMDRVNPEDGSCVVMRTQTEFLVQGTGE